MKRLSIGFILILLATIVPSTAAQDGSIFGMAAGDFRLSTFEALVETAGLKDSLSSGSWTVFAPTDEAFAKLRMNAENVAELSPEDAQGLLLYHAVPGFVSMTDAKAMGGDQVMANGQTAGWKWYDDTLYLNDVSRVIDGNNLASNGYLHIVDTVVQGPWPRPADESEGAANQEDVRSEDLTIVEYLNSDGRFNVTAAAVEYAGLTEMLSSGTWTFFAPNGRAYRQFNRMNANNIANFYTPEEMREFLLYHIYPGHMSIANARTMLGDITMANGSQAGTKWYRGALYVNDFSRVAIRDIHVSNGVIQGVRDVILGPWPRVEAPADPQNSGLIE